MEVLKVTSTANQFLAKPSSSISIFSFRRLLRGLIAVCFLLSVFLQTPKPVDAASGGRMGGGSFRAPSMPRTGGGYGGGYRGGGYGGGYRGGGYGGGYRGGGMGFPFILPIFGFGGGGLFGLLILMAIAGTLVNAIRGTSSSSPIGTNDLNNVRIPTKVSLVQIQIGLLASAKELQNDLRSIANSADTSSSNGLQKVLQETTLSLLRQPNLWVYSNLETGDIPFASAESTFNRLSMTERSKLKAELTSNVSGQILSSNETYEKIAGEADPTNEYIAVTLLIASTKKLSLKDASNEESLSESLRTIGSLTSTELMALEVIWQPEGAGDVLTSEELVTAYPNLKHI